MKLSNLFSSWHRLLALALCVVALVFLAIHLGRPGFASPMPQKMPENATQWEKSGTVWGEPWQEKKTMVPVVSPVPVDRRQGWTPIWERLEVAAETRLLYATDEGAMPLTIVEKDKTPAQRFLETLIRDTHGVQRQTSWFDRCVPASGPPGRKLKTDVPIEENPFWLALQAQMAAGTLATYLAQVESRSTDLGRKETQIELSQLVLAAMALAKSGDAKERTIASQALEVAQRLFQRAVTEKTLMIHADIPQIIWDHLDPVATGGCPPEALEIAWTVFSGHCREREMMSFGKWILTFDIPCTPEFKEKILLDRADVHAIYGDSLGEFITLYPIFNRRPGNPAVTTRMQKCLQVLGGSRSESWWRACQESVRQ